MKIRTTKFTTLFSSFLVFMVIQAMADQSSSSDSKSYGPLKVGYYQESCPQAEDLVRSVVQTAILADPRMAASVVRMLFHDCFVRGCDASVLLDSTPGNPSEKDSISNKNSLRGFEVIDLAKKLVESVCEAKVSCADILSLAARDANAFTGGEYYDVPCGRRDGLVSMAAEADSKLPAATLKVDQLKKLFASKGLNTEDLVVLSGAHTIGRAHCRSFSSRLYNQDPSMDAGYAAELQKSCPNTQNGGSNLVPNDYQTPDVYDNAYYENIQSHKVLFTSDQTLLDQKDTRDLVQEYVDKPGEWISDFSESMVKMSTIGVLTGKNGEIRLNCSRVNE